MLHNLQTVRMFFDNMRIFEQLMHSISFHTKPNLAKSKFNDEFLLYYLELQRMF